MSDITIELCDETLASLECDSEALCDRIVRDIEADNAETLTFDRSELGL